MVWTTEEGFIPIPRPFSPDWKVEIVRSDSTVDDVSNDILYCKFTLIATEGVGSFELKLDDSLNTYSSLYSGNETIKIYLDNDLTAATERFRGIIEKVPKSYTDSYYITLSGRHVSKELMNIMVSKSYTDTEVSAILTDLISNFLTGYTTTNVNTTSTTTTIDFIDENFWDCVKDLCSIANCDFYVDINKDFHFFARNSILSVQAIFPDEVITMSGLGDNIFDVKNRIKVYGQDSSGLIVLQTVDDTASQAIYGIIEAPPISDTTISTKDEAQKTGLGELAILNAKKFQGTVTTFGMPEVNAGEKIWISMPDNSIHNKYRILQITQEFGTDVLNGFHTTFEIEKPTKDLIYLLKDTQGSVTGTDTTINQNTTQMNFSFNLPFDDTTNIETMSGVTINEGKLILTSGSTTGIMESVTLETAVNITYVALRYVGTNTDTSIFEVSTDDGTTWTTLPRNTPTLISDGGNKLKVRVTLNVSGTTNPDLDSMVILYK